MRISKEFTLEVAHRLPNVPAGHKCARLHGHSLRVEIHVTGEPGADSGWICDFADIKEAFAPVFDALDHHYLNEVPGLENPTSENVARWVWERVEPSLRMPASRLCAVVVRETCTSAAYYTAEAAALDGDTPEGEPLPRHGRRAVGR